MLKAVVKARAALAALDQAARRMSNPTVLVNSLPLLEAQASSEIENIVTAADDLFPISQDDSGANPATKETLNHRSALFAGVDSVRSRPVSTVTAEKICATILGRDIGVRSRTGTCIGNPVTRAPIYTPPVGEQLLRDKLCDWETFIHDPAGLDPLVVMALAHYQFEAIHPFDDGNGRTGRILNVLVLMEAGLIAQPILYLSRYIIERKDEYNRLLLAVTRDGQWEEWVLFLLEGIALTAAGTVRKIDEIQDLQESVTAMVRSHTTAGANADLVNVLFEQPYCRIGDVLRRCAVSRPTATKWLNALTDASVVTDARIGRHRLFVNTGFVQILARSDDTSDHVASWLWELRAEVAIRSRPHRNRKTRPRNEDGWVRTAYASDRPRCEPVGCRTAFSVSPVRGTPQRARHHRRKLASAEVVRYELLPPVTPRSLPGVPP